MTEQYDGETLVAASGGTLRDLALLSVYGNPRSGTVSIWTYDIDPAGRDENAPLSADDIEHLLGAYELTVDQALELRHALDKALGVAARRYVTALPTGEPHTWRIELHRRDESGAA